MASALAGTEVARRRNRTLRESENSVESRHTPAARHRSGDLRHRTADRPKPVLRVSIFAGAAGVGQTIGFCRLSPTASGRRNSMKKRTNYSVVVVVLVAFSTLPSNKRSTMEHTLAGRPHKTMVCPTSESQAKCGKSRHRLKPMLPI